MKHRFCRRAALLPIILFILTGFYDKSREGFVIRGHVEGAGSGWAWLLYEYDHVTVTDSAAMQDGRFVLRGHLPEPLVCTLRVSGSNQIRIFFAGNEPIGIEAKISRLFDAVISGSQTNAIWDNYKTHGQEAIGKLITRLRRPGEKLSSQAMDTIDVYKDSVMHAFVSAHTSSSVAGFLVYQNYIVYPDAKRAGRLYAMLGPSIQTGYYGRRIRQFLDAGQNLSIGRTAPAFNLPDSLGQLHPLLSMRGPYLLVDFWASWCGPCRKENTSLLKAYARFHDHGFDIVSVSVDESRTAWLTAVQADRLPWLQLSDGKGTGGPVPEAYGVKAIPRNFLLDSHARIIARDLRGDSLEKKLEEILPDK